METSTLELRDYLGIMRRQRWLIALTFATCLSAGLLYSLTRFPVYVATTTVFIGPQIVDRGTVSDAAQALTFSRDLLGLYAELLRGRTLAERVTDQLGLNIPPNVLAENITSTILQDAGIVRIRAADRDRERAALIANTAAGISITDLKKNLAGGVSVQASIIEPAVPATDPATPSPLRDGVLAGILGLMIGSGGAVLREQIDMRLRTREDAARAVHPLPVLVTVPKLSAQSARIRRFVTDADPNGLAAEVFRILRTNVQFLAVDRPIRRILVTGPSASEGKTTVAANLAASLATAGHTVLLMETDLRRPTIHEYIGAPINPGITEVLLGRAGLTAAIQRTTVPGLSILASGTLPPNPSELLGSERMVDIIEKVSEMHDIVILDSPPTLPVTDAAVLAPRTDGVILVARANQTHRDALRAAAGQFDHPGVRLLGVVFNAADAEASGYAYQYYDNRPYPNRASPDRNGHSTTRGRRTDPAGTRLTPAARPTRAGSLDGASPAPAVAQQLPVPDSRNRHLG